MLLIRVGCVDEESLGKQKIIILTFSPKIAWILKTKINLMILLPIHCIYCNISDFCLQSKYESELSTSRNLMSQVNPTYANAERV